MNRSEILNQSKKRGLSTSEVEASRQKHGENKLSVRKQKSFLRHFISNLSDPVIKILLLALCVNLFFVFKGGDVLETVGIAISVFLAAFISTVSERGGEAAFRKLSAECSRTEVRVWRDGRLLSIPSEEIVVGDLLVLGAGEQIPADCLLISGRVKVDQSPMTGESHEIEKYLSPSRELSPSSPSALLCGCTILSGDCEATVVSIGDRTMLGEISGEIQIDTRESPLKIRLAKLAKQISRLGYLAAIFIALAYLVNSFFLDSAFNMKLVAMKFADTAYVAEHLLHAFMLGLTVIVVAVPEGLPMMIAVVLSSNIKRMIRDNVLVRKPVGIEAAGSMNILFTDKTGTLTEGKLGLEAAIIYDTSTFSSPAELRSASSEIYEAFIISCLLNTSSLPSQSGAVGGNSTDRALYNAVYGARLKKSLTVSKKESFTSEKKYSSVTLSDGRFFVKGAPEKILPNLTHCLNKQGQREIFSKYSYEFIKKINSLTEKGERIILLAYSDSDTRGISGELCLISAVILRDKLRAEAKGSVEELKSAGIKVVMITGDSKDTAAAIAKNCGIITSDSDLILTSEELCRISDEALCKLLPSLSVVARALPKDKSRLVKAAQSLGLVVGMTGDGINDAPALKRADIGFGMGNGTQVAKNASDIIIADSNLSSIAKAVLYGRTIFKSIRKFITLQLTMNFCAVGVSMICPFIGIDAPVTVVQMLWINIIMDTLGGLAFAGEAPLISYMKERPKRRDEPILNKYMIDQILFLGLFTVGSCLAFLKLPSITCNFRHSEDNIYLLTAFFAFFIFSSVFNCFNCRTDRLRLFAGISKNKGFILIMSAVSIIQIAFIYLGGSVLRTVPLNSNELFYTMLLSLLVFPAEMIRKIILRLRGKKSGF